MASVNSSTAVKLLKNSQTWSDLHKQLAEINSTDPKTAGTVFEVIALAFLRSSPLYDIFTGIWTLQDLPAKLQKRLEIGKKDYGIDLVAQTDTGDLFAIQVKFKSDQSSRLGWTKNNLSSWLSGSQKADGRLLFTNASGVDSETIKVASRKKLHLISYSDLSCISRKEILQMLKVLEGKKEPSQILKPRKHQKIAIRQVIKGLKNVERGKLILPCGAGKTLTSLWIAESLGCDIVSVFVPSLALLKQFKDSWLLARKEKWRYLCICSDETVDSLRKEDHAEIHSFEVDINVTTDPQIISGFLKSPGKKVIFSTYQSSKTLSDAFITAEVRSDLIICDEAHRTTVDMRSAFGAVHDNKNFPASKRLYMTATPRILSNQVKAKIGDERLKYIADMSNEKIYGKELYRMTFGEAINQSILSDYKIVAIGVSDSEIRESVLTGETPDGNRIESLAANIALKKAMKSFKINHVFSYHSRVSSAKTFSRRHNEFLSTPIFTTYVSGVMNSNDRQYAIDLFRDAKKGLVSNARCLTEGVDVPSVDGVFFADPKNQLIDIVQAAGRALRKSRNKTRGYIIVPLYHPDKFQVEEFIERSGFKQLLSVVRAISAQDERLEQEIREIKRGRKKSRRSARIKISFGEIELIGHEFDAKQFESSLFDQIIGKTRIPWMEFEEARKFVQQIGLKSGTEWTAYCKGELSGLPSKPIDIPVAAWLVYRDDGWVSIGDWLGTGRVADQLKKYRTFKQARDFTRSLKLKRYDDWREFTKGNLPKVGPLPIDIPTAPDSTYKGKGWDGWRDFLGTGRPISSRWRLFKEAREFVRAKKFPSSTAWSKWAGSSKCPDDIPRYPNDVYKDEGWVDMYDWLGKKKPIAFLDFKKARKVAQRQNIGSYSQWQAYCRGDLHRKKPENIPANPNTVYKSKGWKGWGDWLGTGTKGPKEYKFWSYNTAQRFVSKLSLRNHSEWRHYCAGKVLGREARPDKIPSNPQQIYKDSGWNGWGHFLGTGNIGKFEKTEGQFKAAMKVARELKIKSSSDWVKAKEDARLGNDMPRNPSQVYKDCGWTTWGDFLGTGTVAVTKRKYRSFAAARKFAKSLGLKTAEEWKEYTRGQIARLPRIPDDIPAKPDRVYSESGWTSMGDWLGTGRVATQKRIYRSFKKARAFVRKLNLNNGREWREYAKGEREDLPRLPEDIPRKPSRVYQAEFEGLGDWLGTELDQ